jgi:hypothetical protein
VIHVGFTGTQRGMTGAQAWAVRGTLYVIAETSTSALWCHHGDCIGADADFHAIARAHPHVAGITGHPPDNPAKRAWCHFDKLEDERAYLSRNRIIVIDSSSMIAAPGEMEEQVRSGTWYTIRFNRERRERRPLYLVFPDGTVKFEPGQQVLDFSS